MPQVRQASAILEERYLEQAPYNIRDLRLAMNLSKIKTTLASFVSTDDFELERRAARLTILCKLFFDRYGDGPVSLLRAPARMGVRVLGETWAEERLVCGSRALRSRHERHTARARAGFKRSKSSGS